MNVSPEFSPPIRVTAPYIIAGLLFYLASLGALFFLELPVVLQAFELLGWVHLHMLGFVMMIIFASMAQLLPVLSETHHAHPASLTLVWPLLSAGTLLLAAGFYGTPALLLPGGLAVLAAMAAFAFNLHRTLRQSRRRSSVLLSMRVGTLFLLLGVFGGLLIALGLEGRIGIDLLPWLKAHVVILFGGYVMVSIMGVSTVLLPMFGRARRLSESAFGRSFYTMIAAVTLMAAAALTGISWLEWGALLVLLAATALYLLLVIRFARSRQKTEYDSWSLHIYAAFAALGAAWLMMCFWMVSGNDGALRLAFWLLLSGFVAFLIMGHLYRIVPFLVWFEYYAPLIGEREVPLLHEMVDEKWAKLQFFLSLCGLLAATEGIVTEHTPLFHGGVAVMTAGALLLARNVVAVLRSRPGATS